MERKITINDFDRIESIIETLRGIEQRIEEIHEAENNNIERINRTDIWTGKTQEKTYEKLFELKEDHGPIEEMLKEHILFLTKAESDYKTLELKLEKDIEENGNNLTVNS